MKPGAVEKFVPQEAKVALAKVDALAKYGAEIRDWPLAMSAIDEKIEQQREFVRWWEEHVKSRGNPEKKGDELISAERRLLNAPQAEELTGIRHQTVSKWRKSLSKEDAYRERLRIALFRKADLESAQNHRAEGTGDNEWYTPTKYVETARSVLGSIDLDPASNSNAQEWIGAESFFTKKDNGLEKEWGGKVWLNPPYEQPYIQQFAEKMVQEVEAGRVTEAIMLTHNYTDTAWFHLLANAARAICFTRGRIRFLNVEGDEASPTQGQAFFYFGDRATVFAKAFREIGFVR